MGKASLFKVPVLGTFFTGSAVSRSRATAPIARPCATRSTMLEAGEVLCVYPEGTRQHGPKIQPLQPGAAYLALRAGVPIVPVGIAGAEEILRAHKAPDSRGSGGSRSWSGRRSCPRRARRVSSPRDKVDALTATLADALQVLLDDAYELRDGSSV